MNALTTFFNKLFSSRKAILAFGLVIFYLAGMWLGKIPADIATNAIQWILVTYMTVEGAIDAVRAHKIGSLAESLGIKSGVDNG